MCYSVQSLVINIIVVCIKFWKIIHPFLWTHKIIFNQFDKKKIIGELLKNDFTVYAKVYIKVGTWKLKMECL